MNDGPPMLPNDGPRSERSIIRQPILNAARRAAIRGGNTTRDLVGGSRCLPQAFVIMISVMVVMNKNPFRMI
jgi:hypothetical protein